VWSKIQSQAIIDGRSRMASAPVELAWSNVASNPELFNHFWAGGPLHRASERRTSLHPAQKPVALMRWIIDRWASPGDLVLDPYMGSGPIARACLDTGRRYIGIEIEERYCEIAVKRLAQEVLDFGAPA
jgi:DNA modification methylase